MKRDKLSLAEAGLNARDQALIKKLNTPAKIQDFINSLPFDFREGDKIDRSVKGTLKAGKADCAGGAVLAAAALWASGRRPLLLDLKAPHPDVDHVVAVFEEDGYFGALSKTNHAVLRYREPVYKSVRELVMSYFHEYFLPSGKKTLRSYSKTFDISKYGTRWFLENEAVMDLIHDLDNSPHIEILSKKQIKNMRKADAIEVKAGDLTEN